VLVDPSHGTGYAELVPSMALAAIAAGRNSVGYEVDESFTPTLQLLANSNLADLQKVNVERIKSHLSFVRACKAGNKELKYENSYFGFPVMTAQEKKLRLVFVRQVEKVEEHSLRASYFDDLFIRSISPEELSPERFSPEGLQISFSE